MLLNIQHETRLEYSGRISETVMDLKMTPKSDAHQALRGHRIDVGPAAILREYRDWLGNRVHHFSVLPYHDGLVIVAQSVVETQPEAKDLATASDPLPVEVRDHHVADFLRFRGPVENDERLAELSSRLGLPGCRTAGSTVEACGQRLRDHVRYEKGLTSSSTTVSHVLDVGAGVCQDLTHLSIALLRRVGIPARYISGYLYRHEGPSELETHAWVEAFLPSLGWVAVDPTHRCAIGEGHVAVAMGRDFSDVAPNRGVFRGEANERISVNVNIQEVGEIPEGLLAPRAATLDTPKAGGEPEAHREAIDYQQEQQQQ